MPKAVFIHIPKTGGTTLHSLLEPNFQAVCPVRINRLNRLSFAELGRYDLFSGHYDLETTKRIPGQRKVITMLREPKARLLSTYYFARSHSWDFVNRQDKSKAAEYHKRGIFYRSAKEKDLLTWLIEDGLHLHNLMTRMLSGPEASLDVAISNLVNEVDVFGVMENMPLSVEKIFNNLGLPAPESIPHHFSESDLQDRFDYIGAVEKEEVTADIDYYLDYLTALDRELYEIALGVFYE